MNHKLPISSLGGAARKPDSTGAGVGGMLFENTGCGAHGHKTEGCVVYYNVPNTAPMTNGDRVRVMCDGALAELFACKVIDQVALSAVEAGRPIDGWRLEAMKEAWRYKFFSWLRSPAEGVGNG